METGSESGTKCPLNATFHFIGGLNPHSECGIIVPWAGAMRQPPVICSFLQGGKGRQTQNQEQPQVIFHDESLADHMSGNCQAWRFTALRNCAYPVGNRTVYCTLYIIDRADAVGNRASLAGAASAHFAIGLDSGAERALCLLDRVHQPAEQVFELLTRHAVTPCHLTDVLEDMAAVS